MCVYVQFVFSDVKTSLTAVPPLLKLHVWWEPAGLVDHPAHSPHEVSPLPTYSGHLRQLLAPAVCSSKLSAHSPRPKNLLSV